MGTSQRFGESAPNSPTREFALRVVMAAPVAMAVITAARVWRQHWSPIGDWAAMWLRADDVFTRHTPLAGSYSTHGWSHPGPSIHWLVWLLKHISFDSVPRSFAIMALLNAATIVATVRLARRYLGLDQAIITGLFATVLAHTLAGHQLGEFWNPYPPMVWFFAFAVGCFVVLRQQGTHGASWTVIFGALAAQAHLSFLMLVVAIAAVVAGWLLWDRHRTAHEERGAVPLRWLVIGVLLWLPIPLDVVFGNDNPIKILRYFGVDHPQRIGLSHGLQLGAGEFAPWGPLLNVTRRFDLGGIAPSPIWWLMLPVAMLTFGCLAAWHYQARLSTPYLIVAGVVLLIVPLSAAALEGYVFEYLLTYISAAALVMWWAIANAIALALTRRRRSATEHPRSRLHVCAALSAVALATSALWISNERYELPAARFMPAAHAAAQDFVAKVGPLSEPIGVDFLHDDDGLVTAGVIGELARHYDVRTYDGAQEYKWGYTRSIQSPAIRHRYTVIVINRGGLASEIDKCILRHVSTTLVNRTAMSPTMDKRFGQLFFNNIRLKGQLPPKELEEFRVLRDYATRVIIVEGSFNGPCIPMHD